MNKQSGSIMQQLSTPRKKMGRNEICHCGSGMKYKNCHLSTDNFIKSNLLVLPGERYNRHERQMDKFVSLLLNGDDKEKKMLRIQQTGLNILGLEVEFFQRNDPNYHVDCAVGCDYCCHSRVFVTPVEAIFIAMTLKDRLNQFDLIKLKQKLSSNLQEISRLDELEFFAKKIPCGFLNNGNCSIYPYLPIICRTWNSRNVSMCKESVGRDDRGQQIDPNLNQLACGQGILSGILKGLKRAGYYGEPLEITSAIKLGLENKNILAEYLAGEPVFDSALVQSSESVITY